MQHLFTLYIHFFLLFFFFGGIQDLMFYGFDGVGSLFCSWLWKYDCPLLKVLCHIIIQFNVAPTQHKLMQNER